MSKKSNPPPSKSFEDSIAELAAVVRDLEEGKLSLDKSLERYEEGVGHLTRCQKILAEAERKIEILSGVDAEGNPVIQRFDDEEMTLEEKADKRSRRRTAAPKRGAAAKRAAAGSPPPDSVDVDENGTLF